MLPNFWEPILKSHPFTEDARALRFSSIAFVIVTMDLTQNSQEKSRPDLRLHLDD